MLEHAAQRPDAPALREKEYGIWQTLTWAQLAQLVRELALGLAQAGLQRGQHVVVIGENRRRLYASMLAAQALGAVPVPLYQDAAAAEFVFPIDNAEIAFAIVEDQEQVDKLLEIRDRCPRLAHIWYDEPRGLRHYAEPGLAGIDALIEQGRSAAFAAARAVRRGSGQDRAARRGRDVFHQRHHRQSERRGAYAFQFARPGRRRPPLRSLDVSRGGDGLPAAGLDRAEHFFSYAQPFVTAATAW